MNNNTENITRDNTHDKFHDTTHDTTHDKFHDTTLGTTRSNTQDKLSIKDITLIAVFATIISVISIIPTGVNILGVPLTLQTFAMALVGFTLGSKKGTLAVLVYILLGAIGVPVFNGLNAGIHVIASPVGGFIIGFLAISFCSGIRHRYSLMFGIISLIPCHILGIIVACFFIEASFESTFVLVSLPYIPKDIISVILAYISARAIKKSLKGAGISL